MLGIFAWMIGLTAWGIQEARNTAEDEERRRRNYQNGFDTYVDTKGVQRSTLDGRSVSRVRIGGGWGDEVLTDGKKIYRNYSQEERNKEADRLAKWNEQYAEANKKYKEYKIDAMLKYVVPKRPTNWIVPELKRIRVSDGLELVCDKYGSVSDIWLREKEYNLIVQIVYFDYKEKPWKFLCEAARAADRNRKYIDSFPPNGISACGLHERNPKGFKDKYEYEAWAKQIGALFTVEDSYKKIGEEMPDWKLIREEINPGTITSWTKYIIDMGDEIYEHPEHYWDFNKAEPKKKSTV